MNLRQNGLMMILLTVLLGIAAQWAGVSEGAKLWALPLALLLLLGSPMSASCVYAPQCA